MRQPLSLAVLGFGRFGRIHALRARALPGIEVVCVVDPDPQARDAAQAMGFDTLDDLERLPSHVRAAAVVTPAGTHASLAVALMHRGIDVLVEKPLAECESDIEDMLDAARRTGRRLFTGHIERFNPALARRPWKQGPAALVFRRQSRLSGTARSVALDLMVHDLDLAAYLLGSSDREDFQVLDIQATGQGVRVAVRMSGIPVEFHAQHSADNSRASLAWSEGHGWMEVPLSAQPDTASMDALSCQYAAFLDALEGRSTALAHAQDGALAARRALAIVAKL